MSGEGTDTESQRERVIVRSYSNVLDRVERRIFHIDRWRVPIPEGVSVRSLAYAAAAYVIVGVLSQLPVSAQLLGVLPASIRWLALPIGAGILLASWDVDGRPPHRALIAAGRFALEPKCLAGLRATERVGTIIVGTGELTIAPGDGARPARGKVAGPARVWFGRPAQIRPETHSGRPAKNPRAAARIRVGAMAAKPLARAKFIDVPEGKELVFGR